MKKRILPIVWIIIQPFLFPEPGISQPPAFNPLGLSSGRYQATQGWVYSPVELDLLPGYASPPSSPTLMIQGEETGGIALGGGLNLGGLRLNLYGIGSLSSSEEERGNMELNQIFTDSGIAQTLRTDKSLLHSSSLRHYGVRLGMSSDRMGAGLSFLKREKKVNPSSFAFSFPDTEVSASNGEFLSLISSPTQGEVLLRTSAQGEDEERIQEFGVDGGFDLGPIYILGSAVLGRSLTGSQGEIKSDLQGFRVNWNDQIEEEYLDLKLALGNPPRSEEGWLWAIGGGYRQPLSYTFQEGSFYDGRVPPDIKEEWSRERELISRTFRELSALALFGFYRLQPDEEVGGGWIVSYAERENQLSLRERLRLRRVGEGTGFGQGEGGGVWREREEDKVWEVGFSAGVRRRVLPGVNLVGGGAIRYQEGRVREDRVPQELRAVTGAIESSPGVLDPLFFPYSPTTFDLGGGGIQRGFLFSLSGGIELSLGSGGSLNFYLFREGENRRILLEFTFSDL